MFSVFQYPCSILFIPISSHLQDLHDSLQAPVNLLQAIQLLQAMIIIKIHVDSISTFLHFPFTQPLLVGVNIACGQLHQLLTIIFL
jgi:hypothetical protein